MDTEKTEYKVPEHLVIADKLHAKKRQSFVKEKQYCHKRGC